MGKRHHWQGCPLFSQGVLIISLCTQAGDVSFPQESCQSTLHTWKGKNVPWPQGVVGSLPASGCLLCPGLGGCLLALEGVEILMCPPGCPHILQVLGGFIAALTSSQESQLSRQGREKDRWDHLP